jgi:hypothetical protein
MVKGWHFFTATIVALLPVIGFNFFVRHLAANLPPQHLLRRIAESAPSARLVLLGDSQMDAGGDPRALAEACPAQSPATNAALGATMASEHCLILEYLLARAPSLETVVYGFHDNLLTQPVPGAWRDLVGNRALAYLFPERAAALLAPGDDGERWRIRWSASVPMIAERLAIWAKVERLRRQLASFGLPAENANRFGRARDFAAFEPRSEQAFESNLKAVVERRRPLNWPVQQILRNCAAPRLKFCLVEMPVPLRHRERFYGIKAWASYRSYLQKLVGSRSGTFIDASDWVDDEDFVDPLHLNPAGAAVFSARLAQQLCGEFSPATVSGAALPPCATTFR